MKNGLYTLLLFSLLSVGCQSGSPEGATTPTTGATLPATPPENQAPEKAQGSYVGKTTVDLDALGMHYCGGQGAGEASDGSLLYASTYALSDEACRNGENRIFLERKLSNDASGKANMLVLAELVVVTKEPEKAHFITQLSINGGKKEDYVVEYYEDGSQTVKQVGKLWLINKATEQFEEVAVPAGFSFPHPYNDLGD
jgi:hypothetical protein